ncbi:MAG: hypothetical protein ACXVCX_20840, partial [Ktedonobacterales bacterium]
GFRDQQAARPQTENETHGPGEDKVAHAARCRSGPGMRDDTRLASERSRRHARTMSAMASAISADAPYNS